jgi:predicted AlkP superfamily pyrophosphatase or phosphodiesterase
MFVLVVLFLAGDVRAESRMVIISVDGLRPDLALRADMPHLRSLMKRGSFTFWATTTPMAVTLPSHTSMLTGCTIEKHGISGNSEKAVANQPILVPTIFDLAKKANISTGMAAGKSKFSMYAAPIDLSWVSPTTTTADDVATHAVEIIHTKQPRLMFIHFPQVDATGHKKGWGTREQIEAIEETDKALGRVLKELDDSKLTANTTIILSADHGGTALTHGAGDPRSLYIPWVIAGPGIFENVDLAQFKDLKVQTYDTFATACYILDIPLPKDIDGVPVMQAFKGTDLLTPGIKSEPGAPPVAPGTPVPPAIPATPASPATQPAASATPATQPTGTLQLQLDNGQVVSGTIELKVDSITIVPTAAPATQP